MWPKLGQNELETGNAGDQRRSSGRRGATFFIRVNEIDPLGGINSLWPLFRDRRIQLLAAVALCVATTVLVKMYGARYMWITMRAAGVVDGGVLHGGMAEDFRLPLTGIGIPGAGRCHLDQGPQTAATAALIFQCPRLDAGVTAVFLMILVAIILVDSIRVWIGILSGSREAK